MLEAVKTTIKGVFSSKNKPQEPEEERIGDINDPVFQQDIINFVKSEFERRKEERMPFELQWQLNTNFLLGNQYCDINMEMQAIVELEKDYYWQERGVYNHIAPITETRLAKLGRVRPAFSVRPASNDLSDISTAKVCTKILQTVTQKQGLSSIIQEATNWSEICGTVLYKVTWDFNRGELIGVIDGEQVFEGDVDIVVVPPYEFFPDSSYSANLELCRSVIHARAYHVDEIEEIWGVKVEGRDVDVFSLDNTSVGLGGLGYTANVPKIAITTKQDHELVIEYYERPSKKYKDGRLIITAGDKLLYYGSLPYAIGDNGRRDFPFERQVCVDRPGCFWGVSVIERCIPIQRAYNAVKNRKHEYLNRAALGVFEAEEGAYDEDDLIEDGLSPGKILLRQPGRQPGQFLRPQDPPTEFAREEDKLQNEFILISGVSEISRNSAAPTGAGSGVALSILTEQDDTRLSLSAEHIRSTMIKIGKKILRLYKQFAVGMRMDRLVGESGDVLRLAWQASDITSDDVVLETENELSLSPAQRKQMLIDLMQMGLFHNPETGTIDKRMRTKLFEALQMGNWEVGTDLEELQINRAQRENMLIMDGEIPIIREIDDDEIHIAEHKRFMLSGDFEKLIIENPYLAQEMDLHVKQHERARDLKQNLEMTKMQLMQYGYVPD